MPHSPGALRRACDAAAHSAIAAHPDCRIAVSLPAVHVAMPEASLRALWDHVFTAALPAAAQVLVETAQAQPAGHVRVDVETARAVAWSAHPRWDDVQTLLGASAALLVIRDARTLQLSFVRAATERG